MKSETGNQKLFSIIIATYNCGRKIEKTLQSIFSQKRELFEVIVFDNASTDDTLDWIKKYQGDLTLVSEKDGGIYDAFNKGIDLAGGKYLYFLGAGDCLRPEILEQISGFLPETPTFFYGNCFFVERNGEGGGKFKSSRFITHNICHQGIFYHREIFEMLGKYDPRYKIFADWFFNSRCFLNHKIEKEYVPIIIADYEGGGLSGSISDREFQKDFPIFVKEHFGFLKYLVSKMLWTNPNAFYFVYYTVYNFLGRVIPIARPFVHRYRNLRKVVRKKV